MTITGILQFSQGQWTLTDANGKTYTLSGGNFPTRANGLQVRIIGVKGDDFGGGVLHGEVTVLVQQWRAL